MAISPQGYDYPYDSSVNPFWNGNAGIKDISFSQSGDTVTVTVTYADGTETPQTFTVGSSSAITGISLTNENGIYTIKATTADGQTSEVGTIEIPAQERGIVEVKDAVVENETDGYDFHTLTETEDGGTENEIGKFYIARNPITKIPASTENLSALLYETVGQDGIKGSGIIHPLGICPVVCASDAQSEPDILDRTLAYAQFSISVSIPVGTGTATYTFAIRGHFTNSSQTQMTFSTIVSFLHMGVTIYGLLFFRLTFTVSAQIFTLVPASSAGVLITPTGFSDGIAIGPVTITKVTTAAS